MKTRAEAIHLAKEMERQLKNLPDNNVFGESNVEEKRLIADVVEGLYHYASTGDTDRHPHSKSWICGEDDYFLKDFLS